MVLAADWAVGEVLWSMLWLFLFIIWIFLAFRVFMDIFRDHEMSGWAKALWVLFVIVFPFLGILVYLIARGGKMAQNEVRAAQKQEEQFRSYVQDVAGSGGGGGGTAAELERLAALRDKGVLTDEEFASLKAKALA
jgi:hypothetical protein